MCARLFTALAKQNYSPPSAGILSTSWFSPSQSPKYGAGEGGGGGGGVSYKSNRAQGSISAPKSAWCSLSHGEMLRPNTSWQITSP